MALLTREKILKSQDLPRRRVNTPEWGKGTYVFVRAMTGAERDEFEDHITSRQGRDVQVNIQNIRAQLCVRTICDDEGKLIFSAEDADVLGGKSAQVLDRIFAIAQELSGLGDDEMEKLAKNSSSAQSGASS